MLCPLYNTRTTSTCRLTQTDVNLESLLLEDDTTTDKNSLPHWCGHCKMCCDCTGQRFLIKHLVILGVGLSLMCSWHKEKLNDAPISILLFWLYFSKRIHLPTVLELFLILCLYFHKILSMFYLLWRVFVYVLFTLMSFCLCFIYFPFSLKKKRYDYNHPIISNLKIWFFFFLAECWWFSKRYLLWEEKWKQRSLLSSFFLF